MDLLWFFGVSIDIVRVCVSLVDSICFCCYRMKIFMSCNCCYKFCIKYNKNVMKYFVGDIILVIY